MRRVARAWFDLPSDNIPETNPALIRARKDVEPCIRASNAIGPRSKATSARNTTAVNTKSMIAVLNCVGDGLGAFGALFTSRYDARFTAQDRLVIFQETLGRKSVPGSSANMLGNVLPIQKGT